MNNTSLIRTHTMQIISKRNKATSSNLENSSYIKCTSMSKVYKLFQ